MTRTTLKKWLLRAAIALPALLAIVALVVWSGVVSVKASAGHWAITNWFLHTAMRRSVNTYSKLEKLPDMGEPWLVLKGAGHYETGCRPCHGAPDVQPPVIPQAMTPHPPYLSTVISEWSKEELFYVVKHGIKPTAMPAWPTLERDDEVAAVVAFLLEMPKLDADGYRKLVDGDTGPSEAAAPLGDLVPSDAGPLGLAASCARCHGRRGEGRGSAAFPKLAQQTSEYQYNALLAYARAERHSGIMQPIAAGLNPREMRRLADYYAQLSGEQTTSTPRADDARHERSAEIVNSGLPKLGVPACAECHGPGTGARNPAYPKLAGQYKDYLLLQLKLFKSKKRGGSPYAHLMQHVASRLTEAQMEDVSSYYASLPVAARERGVE
jgi:cytochrome c553